MTARGHASGAKRSRAAQTGVSAEARPMAGIVDEGCVGKGADLDRRGVTQRGWDQVGVVAGAGLGLGSVPPSLPIAGRARQQLADGAVCGLGDRRSVASARQGRATAQPTKTNQERQRAREAGRRREENDAVAPVHGYGPIAGMRRRASVRDARPQVSPPAARAAPVGSVRRRPATARRRTTYAPSGGATPPAGALREPAGRLTVGTAKPTTENGRWKNPRTTTPPPT